MSFRLKGVTVGLHFRAALVARVFDILSWIIIIVGGFALVSGIATGLFSSLRMGLFIIVSAVVYTVVAWSFMTLGAVVAGYVARETADA